MSINGGCEVVVGLAWGKRASAPGYYLWFSSVCLLGLMHACVSSIKHMSTLLPATVLKMMLGERLAMLGLRMQS
jgi:hypothetical protein